jgi:hypothetical protein
MKGIVKFFSCGIWIVLFAVGTPTKIRPNKPSPKREADKQYILEHYSAQLTSPEKEKRKSFSQFGYGLSFFPFPLFPITGFIDPNDFGEHSYGKPNVKEKNGALYTCRGGFIDFSHIRVATDWTVYIAFKMICDQEKEMDLPCSDGKLSLKLKNIDHLSLEDLLSISQKVAYERLIWHEICSWYYQPPNYTFNEKQSTFTPEDTYSNFLGTIIGRHIVLRILQKREGLPFSQIASEEIQKTMAELFPVSTKKQTQAAYDIVDANKQAKLPLAERNKDVWWNSKVVFTDERYVFKRYMTIGPQLIPWVVPKHSQAGCGKSATVEVLSVPQHVKSGASIHDYYTLSMTPDSALFYNKRTNEEMHKPFPAFASKDIQKMVDHVNKDMQQELLAGFNKRNKSNPEKKYNKLQKIWFR